MAEPKVLVAVLAHPDDETFGMGGTLALYAQRGVQVHLVCATRGEVGEADPEHLQGFASVGEMRSAELACAAEILGLAGVHYLGYRDSGMPGSPDNQHPDAQIAQPLEQVAAEVVRHLRALRPQVVLTFDPVGGYFHPDHIHIQRATTLAFERAADPQFAPGSGAPFTPARLYYHTMPHGLLKAAVLLMRVLGRDPHRFGRNGDIDLAAIAAVDFPTHARIDIHPVLAQKERAAACHSSQGGGKMGGALAGWVQRLFGASETFMQASPPIPVRAAVQRDLFPAD